MTIRNSKGNGSSTAPQPVRRRVTLLGLTALLTAVCTLAGGISVAQSASASTAAPATVTTSSNAGALDPSQFHGVNWADPRDNYVNGPVIPSGLSTGDNYATTYAKAHRILSQFRSDLGANTVRLPVNPYSVGTSWWTSYRAVIDAARHDGFSVILSYWEGSGAEKDGRVDDPAAWYGMWNTLTSTFKGDRGVYFEPMNEPFGYSATDWEQLVTTWVERYTAQGIPRNRIFVSGTGYNDHVNTVCGVAALDGTYVSQHYYGFWGSHDAAGWAADFASRLGDQECSARTVLDEFGVPMTTGIDYTATPTTGNADADNSVAFLQAVTTIVRDRNLGAVYWPGLRTGDTYSLETLQGSGTRLSLAVNNPSGVDLLRWAWGYGGRAPFSAQ